jgi:hypothetical protein
MSDLDAEIESQQEQHHEVRIRASFSHDGPRSLIQDEDRRNDNLKDRFIGAIDQGTTSTRFIIFDCTGNPIAKYQSEFRQIHEHSGYAYLQTRTLRPWYSLTPLSFSTDGMNKILSSWWIRCTPVSRRP